MNDTREIESGQEDVDEDEFDNEVEYSAIDKNKNNPWIFVGALTFIGGVVGIMISPSDPATGFLVLAMIFGGIGWVTLTESGQTFVKEMSDLDQQQQQIGSSSSSEPKKICSECGWQNPQSNNYCHDCGSEL